MGQVAELHTSLIERLARAVELAEDGAKAPSSNCRKRTGRFRRLERDRGLSGISAVPGYPCRREARMRPAVFSNRKGSRLSDRKSRQECRRWTRTLLAS